MTFCDPLRDHRRVLLAVTADDYGYADAYDAGMVEAAAAGAIDGASVMAMRKPDPAPLLAAGIELGVHLEPAPAPARQLAAFVALVGDPPAFIDGHHHCHAARELAEPVAQLGVELGVPVRGIGDAHRALLRERGVASAALLIGRLSEDELALPPELAGWLAGEPQPDSLVEWFTHPGYADPSTGSSYDAGREQDLALLLELGPPSRWAERGIRRVPLGRALSA